MSLWEFHYDVEMYLCAFLSVTLFFISTQRTFLIDMNIKLFIFKTPF